MRTDPRGGALRPLVIAALAGSVTAFFLAVSSCTPSARTARCVDAGDCLGDKPQACLDEVCVEVECIDGASCGINEWCNENNRCIPGCDGDDDCLAGERCDLGAHACLAYGCRSAQLDCAIGELCDTSTGDCYRDTSRPNCESCDPYDWWNVPCGGAGECLSFQGEEEGWCFGTCQPSLGSDACPRGYECVNVPELGNYCVAYCPILEDLGYL